MRGRRIGMVFQDPLTSLNPLYRIGDQIVETIRTHRKRVARRRRASAPSRCCRRPASRAPGRASTAIRTSSRAACASAWCWRWRCARSPISLIADEPTTALDVSIQAQIIALLKRLCRERGTAVMLITHDMGVIAETADRVAVMYAGRIAEIGPVRDVVQHPRHPYTKGLMGAIPTSGPRPSGWCRSPAPCRASTAIPKGCAFHPRCAYAFDRCRVERPEAMPAGRSEAACWLVADERRQTRRGTTGAGMMRRAAGRGQGPHARVRRLQALAQPRHRGRAQGLPEGRERRLLRHRPARDGGAGGRVGLGQVDGGAHDRRAAAAHGRHASRIDGIDMWATARAAERQKLRRRLQMIFQDPYASLNPRWRVERIIADPIKAFGLAKDKAEIEHRVGELLRAGRARPGGRAPNTRTSSPAGSASASASPARLSSNPEFIVCDEPTSALDVSVQAQILNLMRDLQDRLGLSYLFISHNLAVVRHMATRIGVMYLGRIVEMAPSAELFAVAAPPLHAPADGRAARPRHERTAAPADRGRDPQPDCAAARMRLPSALPVGVRALQGGRAGARWPRRPVGCLPRCCGGASVIHAQRGQSRGPSGRHQSRIASYGSASPKVNVAAEARILLCAIC